MCGVGWDRGQPGPGPPEGRAYIFDFALLPKGGHTISILPRGVARVETAEEEAKERDREERAEGGIGGRQAHFLLSLFSPDGLCGSGEIDRSLTHSEVTNVLVRRTRTK